MNFIKEPLAKFIKLETSGSIVLFLATVSALVLANSPLSDSFLNFWKIYISINLPGLELSKPVIKWINDGLMVVFFFLIGLEIKRELILGELNNFKKASLPFFAAIGGMVFPALFFIVLNYGQPGSEGWGIPVATDIAFALGILQLLGKRVPIGLKVFLMAFAIIDDLGAIVIIALFYSSNLVWEYIGIGMLIVALLLTLSYKGYYSKYFFFLMGVVVWVLFLKSGIHATIAGVLLAFTIPIKRKTNTKTFYNNVKKELDLFLADCDNNIDQTKILTENQLSALEEIEELAEKTSPPLQNLEHSLHGWVSYLIMPLFAFANAGVVFNFSGDTNLGLSANIALSMIFGKAIGIFLFSFLSIKTKLSALPDKISYKMIGGISILGGLGFTMSLFINNLAYTDQAFIDSAKMGILIGSIITGIVGFLVLKAALNGVEKNEMS
ncbi:MAG TPA: Na+/H+ antiporter NhaA [Draconibacterium sp.]|nr:Na+/H+ antiporter NhaA [Draconibacterium sp.]HRX10860.1 Na+/H+ antiporter NhaA [Draconibacterium sp.]